MGRSALSDPNDVFVFVIIVVVVVVVVVAVVVFLLSSIFLLSVSGGGVFVAFRNFITSHAFVNKLLRFILFEDSSCDDRM